MLVKVEDGFYLNSQHIIAVRISKKAKMMHLLLLSNTLPIVRKIQGYLRKNSIMVLMLKCIYRTCIK